MAFEINAAVLHILDFSRGVFSFSDEQLNLEDETIAKYVGKALRKAAGDTDAGSGEFNEFSPFLELLKRLDAQELSFTEFTLKVANRLQDELADVTSEPLDLLFISYEEDEVPYAALLILENQAAYTHETGIRDDHIYNQIVYAPDILPGTERKIRSFAIINRMTKKISLRDEIRWNISDLHVMADTILHCSEGQSHKEIMKTMTTIAADVAEQYDENPTVLLTKMKSYMKQAAEDELPVDTADLAVHVFNASEDMQNTFLEKSMEADLPKEVKIPQKTISREMKRQRIQTDTGITLSFPVEYASDPGKIEFINHEDGTITIELRHIGHITNRE